MNYGALKTLVKNFAFALMTLLALQPAKAQTLALEECFGDDDLYGKAWFSNPNDVTLPNPSYDNLVFSIEGCLTPSEVDYDDLFSFHVPEGYVLESIHFSEMDALFDITELNFYFWIGDDCQPVFEPDASYEGLQNDEPTGANMISSLTPLGPGWYSGWIDMDWPSTTTYVLIITLACNDNVAPSFTTNAGALDGAAECSNQAAIDALLDLEPAGTDNNGPVTIDLISDETNPNPACPNAYTRVRTWSVTDGCGNAGPQNFVQTIAVNDNTGPELQTKNAEVTITDPAGYTLVESDVVVDAYDLCGDAVNVSFNPSVLTCAQLNTVVAVTVIAEDACGNQTQSVAQVSVAEDTSIKAPWHNDNVGNTANGSATHSVCSDGYTVKSKGFSMPQSDVAHYAYVELCGNGEITVQVTSLAPAGGWAGVMIRESLAPGAKKVAVRTNLTNAIRRDIRTTANGTTQTQQSVIIPGQHWLRLNRNGNTISVYAATDGNQWSLLGAVPVTMGNCVLMGMFVESTNNNLEITGTFDNVSVSGGIQALVMPDDNKPEFAQSELESKQTNTNQVQPQWPAADVAAVTEATIKAFPNPSSGDFQIDLAEFEGKDIDVQIMDAAGKTVVSKHIIGAAATEAFQLNGAMPGLYLIKVCSADRQQMATARLILAK